MLLSGYSINILTMFGMVLAIGIIVDDAIVVVENIERLMEEKALSPREAAAGHAGNHPCHRGYHACAHGGVYPDGLC